MRILVTGAAGFIGASIVRRLLREGHEVLAGVHRNSAAPGGSRAMPMDFESLLAPEDWRPRLENVQVVINCVGIISESRGKGFENLHSRAPVALFQACVAAGVRKVIQISALGADETAFSRYHLSKRAADDFLAATPLEWVILQPSLVYGSGGQSTAFLAGLAALPLIPLVGGGNQPLQPVHVDDLTDAVARLLDDGAPSRQRLPVVGPEPVRYRALLGQLRRWVGLSAPRFVSVPLSWALRFGDGMGDRLGGPMNGEAIRMLERGNTGDPQPLTALLGRKPVPLRTALAPGAALRSERLASRLFVVLPALRVALALLWIWSGITSAFIYPKEASYALLDGVGVSASSIQPLALYGASLFDFVLGLALLWRFWVRTVGRVQIAAMLVYSAVIAWYLPEFLLHPFAPVAKNLPLVFATWVVMAAED